MAENKGVGGRSWDQRPQAVNLALPEKLQSKEGVAKYIIGWWHRLSSLCKCLFPGIG
jgi:hypothetical protein